MSQNLLERKTFIKNKRVAKENERTNNCRKGLAKRNKETLLIRGNEPENCA